MFTSLTEKLTYSNSSIYNYRPCSRWGPAHHPSTKGSPCFCTKMRPSVLGRKGILKVFNKCTMNVKANPIYSIITQFHLSPKHAKSSDDKQITNGINLRKSFLAGLRDRISSTPDSNASHVSKRQFHALLSISNLVTIRGSRSCSFLSSLHFNVLRLLHPLSARHLSLASTARSSRLLFAI